ncbi:glycosyltransferase [Persicitalea sp.]|uniref:glycosyltransferase n=1 Tax=Persicitalea sp. TaxID=3100273 RepID=UPI003593C7E9
MGEEFNTIKVSILVAARNEENNVVRCLEALDNLDFPKPEYEVLIGNDHSSDQTEEMILNFIGNKPNYNYHLIHHQTAGLKGKANVLAQLSHYAKGEYFFYCDADIAVAPTWLSEMLGLFNKNTGVVVGVTRMTRTGLFSAMQSLEWLFSLTAMRFFSRFEVPFTGMGNNMAVTSEAYRAVGGYEGIGFSIVEDFALFVAIIGQGYSFVQGFQPGIISLSQPTHTLSELLIQRKRWVKGAMQAPWQIKLSFFASAVFIPSLLILLFFAPLWSLCLALLHYFLVLLVGFIGLIILKQKDLLKYLPLFWFYFNLNNTLMLINYLRPTSTTWKGRVYE